jgi:hypothetical protein
MHHSRIATFLLGLWLAGIVVLSLVASVNFDLAREVLKAPPAPVSKMVETLGAERSRALLRHLAEEENLYYFEVWETAEIALGVALIAVLFLGAGNRLLAGLSGAMLALTLFAHFKITPEIAWLGRSIEFISWTADSSARDQFWKLHAMYGVIEGAKLLLGCVIAVLLFALRRRSRRVEQYEPLAAR